MRSPKPMFFTLFFLSMLGCDDGKSRDTATDDYAPSEDADGDGYLPWNDCDDDDASIHPGADELPYDGIDQDCDGGDLTDVDGDGYDAAEVAGDDCNDEDDAIHPTAAELCDGLDNDCDGGVDEGFDADADGHWSDECAHGEDCDDSDADVNPEAHEVCGDGVDNDCSGSDATCGFDEFYLLSEADAYQYHAAGNSDAGRLLDVGDADGDGVNDVLVATMWANDNGGGAFLLTGPLSGNRVMDDAGHEIVGDTQVTNGAGRSIGMGDVDGDGFCDVLLGAPWSATDPAAWIVFGPITANTALEESSVYLYGGTMSYTAHGSDLGDLNGDGIADIAVGAYYDSGGSGTIYTVMGPLTSIVSIVDEADGAHEGESANNFTGRAITCGQDVNGDGLDDIVTSAINDGTAGLGSGAGYLLYGPATGNSELSDANGVFRGESPYDNAGVAQAMGDVSGDGLADILLSSQASSSIYPRGGAAYLVLGPASGEMSLAAADAIIRASAEGMTLGANVAIGALDDDGYEDVLVGAPGFSDCSDSGGGAFFFSGPLTGTSTAAQAQATICGDDGSSGAGQGVAIGDVDDDGWGDLIVGAPGAGVDGVYVFYAGI